MNHRDANQGTCTNACRWEYKVLHDDPPKTKVENLDQDTCCNKNSEIPVENSVNNPAYKTYFLEETNRPGELMPIEEDENGTYIMNSKDLRAVEHVERLIKMGINSLKIEGRTKSHYYVARSTQAYRKAINDAMQNKPFDPTLISGLENLANRGYTDGFFKRHHDQEYQNYLNGYSKSNQQIFVGEIIAWDEDTKMAEIDVKNKFSVGNQLELILPSGNRSFKLEDMVNELGDKVDVAPGSGHKVKIKLDKRPTHHALIARQL